MKFLLPKEPAFYENFQQMSHCLSEITTIFQKFAADYKDFESYWRKAKEVEHKADTIAHRVINLLNQSFMTPFDREDIYRLVHELDDIIDLLENTIHNVYLYEMTEKKDFVNEFAQFTREATDKLNALIKECFEKQKYTDTIWQLICDIHDLEDKGDAGLREGAPDAVPGRGRPHQGHQVEGHPLHPGTHHGRLPEGQQHHRRHRRQERLTMGDWNLAFIAFIIFIALAFDFTNGLHDAANSVATVVSTRVLSPSRPSSGRLSSTSSPSSSSERPWPSTIGTGLIDIAVVDPLVIFGGLIGAISWNLLTWYWGLPSSSSHSLIGGYLGAAVAKAGFGVVIVSGWIKIWLFIVLAPILGLVLGNLFMVVDHWICPQEAAPGHQSLVRRMQLVSAALYSLGHGGNDAQKTMGIIASLLFSFRPMKETSTSPSGSSFLPRGHRPGDHVRRLAHRQDHGPEDRQAQARRRVLRGDGCGHHHLLATHLGVPVSTTHVITGAMAGVGAVKNAHAVKWQVTLRIVWAWLLTIPAAALWRPLLSGWLVACFNLIGDTIPISELPSSRKETSGRVFQAGRRARS